MLTSTCMSAKVYKNSNTHVPTHIQNIPYAYTGTHTYTQARIKENKISYGLIYVPMIVTLKF